MEVSCYSEELLILWMKYLRVAEVLLVNLYQLLFLRETSISGLNNDSFNYFNIIYYYL